MTFESITNVELGEFMQTHGFSIENGRAAALALSFSFMRTLPWCSNVTAPTEALKEAQSFLAYAMSEEGGGFNPAALNDGRTLIKENLGRSALEDHFQVNDDMQGTDSFTLLKGVPMVFNLLSKYLCPDEQTSDDSSTFKAGAFVV